MVKAKSTLDDYQMRVDFLMYQIKEADKKLTKARLNLRHTYEHKQKLLNTLKEVEKKLDNKELKEKNYLYN